MENITKTMLKNITLIWYKNTIGIHIQMTPTFGKKREWARTKETERF